MSEKRVSASRRIAAPADVIYAIVSSPAGHVQIDGSGMLVSTESQVPRKVGDTFAMHMDRTPLSYGCIDQAFGCRTVKVDLDPHRGAPEYPDTRRLTARRGTL